MSHESPAEGTLSKAVSGGIRKQARPYRSHRYPACARCHKQRSKCTIELPGQACLSCRSRNLPCSAVIRSARADATNTSFVRGLSTSNGHVDEFAQVMGPVLSRDAQVLDSIVSDIHKESERQTQVPGVPIYRSERVSKRPTPPPNWKTQSLSTQLFQQVDPYIERLVALYFEDLHPCLPMMDEQDIWRRLTHQQTLHSLFLTNLIAYTSFYWEQSPALPASAKLDQDFAWDVAGMTMKDHSERGDMFSIIAAVLNVAGRPSKGTVSNTCQIARVAALSNSIGLNHNSAEWNLSQSEKDVRTKLWWTVVVHDRWFHFAQGTPPYISNQYYNVPLPTLSMLTKGRESSLKHIEAAECFIHLCKLTEIVGEILPLIYHIRSGNDAFAAGQIVGSEIQLDSWLDERPQWMTFDTNNRRSDRRPLVPGLANLQMSYLAVRMLLKRMAWHENSLQSDKPEPSSLIECLESAEAVAIFLASLQTQDLSGFWLPYHAQHFTSAVTLLLRCALQLEDRHLRIRAMDSACQLVDRLKDLRDRHGWDLAKSVLPQTETILIRIRNAVPKVYLVRDVLPEPGLPSSSNVSDLVPWTARGVSPSNDTLEFPIGGTLEEMFPELFAEFTDNAFFDLPG